MPLKMKSTDLISGSQVGALVGNHPVFPNRGNRRRSKRGRFCGDLAAYFQRSRVSADKNGLSGGFWASGLCIQKFRSRRQRTHAGKDGRQAGGRLQGPWIRSDQGCGAILAREGMGLALDVGGSRIV